MGGCTLSEACFLSNNVSWGIETIFDFYALNNVALDLGTPSCSGGPLASDLGPQLAQRASGSFKGASLTIDLGTSLALGFNWVLKWGPIYLQGL